jgi:MFS family permease
MSAISSAPRFGDRAGARVALERQEVQMALIIAGCLAVSAVTLLFPSTPTYDPWAWILWGREIAELDLVTEGGPSWKPLPILFTVPFSILGDDLAPYLWLWVARAGGLLGCVMAYRMASRLIGGAVSQAAGGRHRSVYGALAGVSAFAALLSSNKYVRDAALGNSEPILAAVVLWGFERHLDGRRDHALYLGVAAALLRPEAWPFLALYGLWLWFSEPRLRMRLVAFAALVPALWFLPEWWGAGDPFRAGSRANAPNPGSAAFADSPAVELFERFAQSTVAPVELGTLIAVAVAAVAWFRRPGSMPASGRVRHRQGAILALAALGFSWFALVAVMTEAGFAGNQRYLMVTTAAVSVLGGIGAVRVLQGVEWLGGRWSGSARTGRIAAASAFFIGLAIASPTIVAKADNTGRVQGGIEHEAYLWHDLKALIDANGGKERLLACGGVFSGPFQTQMVAYELGVHGINVGWKVTPPPGVAFRTRTVPDGPLVTKPTDDRYRLVDQQGKWRLLTVPPEGNASGACPVSGPNAPTAPAPPGSSLGKAPTEVIGR